MPNFVYPVGKTLKSSRPMIDIYNEDRSRNMNSIVTESCNCGGYALETYNWFLPIYIESVVADNAEEQWLIEHDFDDMDELNHSEIDELMAFVEDEVEREYNRLIDEAQCIMEEDYNDEVEKDINLLYYSSIYDTDIALKLAAEHMLNVFDDLRLIDDLSELEDDEYGIIYRGGKWDFHYVKYDQLTDTYTHKMGFREVEEVEDPEDAFEEEYMSFDIYFAKKRNDFDI